MFPSANVLKMTIIVFKNIFLTRSLIVSDKNNDVYIDFVKARIIVLESDSCFFAMWLAWNKKMKLLSQKHHAILDYLTVLFLALSPLVFNMQLTGEILTYTLALVHLVLTLFTNFELGIFRVIPLYVHGVIEISVALLLIVVSFLFFIHRDNTSFYFYLVFGVVLFMVWAISDYKSVSPFKKLI